MPSVKWASSSFPLRFTQGSAATEGRSAEMAGEGSNPGVLGVAGGVSDGRRESATPAMTRRRVIKTTSVRRTRLPPLLPVEPSHHKSHEEAHEGEETHALGDQGGPGEPLGREPDDLYDHPGPGQVDQGPLEEGPVFDPLEESLSGSDGWGRNRGAVLTHRSGRRLAQNSPSPPLSALARTSSRVGYGEPLVRDGKDLEAVFDLLQTARLRWKRPRGRGGS